MADVEWSQSALNALFNSPDGPVAKDLLRRGARVEAAAKRFCSNDLVNVVTGRLRSSITHVLGFRDGKLVCFVGTNVEYALSVHNGHKSFTVTAAPGKTLRFKGRDGDWVYRRTVTIPATHARPFLLRALPAAL